MQDPILKASDEIYNHASIHHEYTFLPDDTRRMIENLRLIEERNRLNAYVSVFPLYDALPESHFDGEKYVLSREDVSVIITMAYMAGKMNFGQNMSHDVDKIREFIIELTPELG